MILNHSPFGRSLLPCIIFALAQEAIGIPFFGPFRRATTVRTTTIAPVPVPHPYQQLRDQRIINADHGGFGVPPQSSSYAGGNIGYSPWISGTKDQFIRNQLVILHPDSSSLNREAWKESSYLNPDFDPTPRKANNASSTPKPTPARPQTSSPLRARKLYRKSKQQQLQEEQGYVPGQPQIGSEPVTGSSPDIESSPSPNTIRNLEQQQHQQSIGGGGLYDYPQPMYFRDMNGEVEDGTPIIGQGEPILFNGNNMLIPITASYPYPYQPRGGIQSQQQLPPEAMIQFLKSPEQELSSLTRPQVKLPFPLRHDCSASSGGSRNKPLQFVVLPIVEPVAPLKPIFSKPSGLSQYGQFPYIPPFNLFQRPAPTSQDSQGGASGQFVPILNRPTPPLPFVFVQSLPLELIGQNQDMDFFPSASPTMTSEKIKEVPIAAPPPTPTPTSPPQTTVAAPLQSTQQVENAPIPSITRPLPLIVIEKVKSPGQAPSSPLPPGASVVEITKQSIQKSTGSAPISTISVVQPITAPGSKPPTLQQQQERQKAIEKLVPVAAAVLENVEMDKQKQQGRDRDTSKNVNAPVLPKPTTISNEEKLQQVPNVGVPVLVPLNEHEKTPLRPPLRPANEGTVLGGIPPINAKTEFKRPDISSSEEIGTGASTLTGVEVTEA